MLNFKVRGCWDCPFMKKPINGWMGKFNCSILPFHNSNIPDDNCYTWKKIDVPQKCPLRSDSIVVFLRGSVDGK